MREVGVVYRADILLLGGLHLYWLYTEVSHKSTTSTHVTLTVLSHLDSIAQGCKAVQWYQGPQGSPGVWGQRPL